MRRLMGGWEERHGAELESDRDDHQGSYRRRWGGTTVSRAPAGGRDRRCKLRTGFASRFRPVATRAQLRPALALQQNHTLIINLKYASRGSGSRARSLRPPDGFSPKLATFLPCARLRSTRQNHPPSIDAPHRRNQQRECSAPAAIRRFPRFRMFPPAGTCGGIGENRGN